MIGLDPFWPRRRVFDEPPGPLLRLPFFGFLLQQRVQLALVLVGNRGQPFEQLSLVPLFGLGFSFRPAEPAELRFVTR